MTAKNKSKDLSLLAMFIKQNKTLDLKKANLIDPDVINTYSWKRIKKNQTKILELLRAYQRLSRILPLDSESIIYALLGNGLHSALQIAAMPKARFVTTYLSCFDSNKELANQCYANAQAKRSRLLLDYMKFRSK